MNGRQRTNQNNACQENKFFPSEKDNFNQTIRSCKLDPQTVIPCGHIRTILTLSFIFCVHLERTASDDPEVRQ